MTGMEPPHAPPHRTPPWVKGFIVAGIVLVVAVTILLLAGGDHGPGRHAP